METKNKKQVKLLLVVNWKQKTQANFLKADKNTTKATTITGFSFS